MTTHVDGTTAAQFIRDFEKHLSNAARRRLNRDMRINQLIIAAISNGWQPKALAEQVAHGITHSQPTNARERMIHRLHLAAKPKPTDEEQD